MVSLRSINKPYLSLALDRCDQTWLELWSVQAQEPQGVRRQRAHSLQVDHVGHC